MFLPDPFAVLPHPRHGTTQQLGPQFSMGPADRAIGQLLKGLENSIRGDQLWNRRSSSQTAAHHQVHLPFQRVARRCLVLYSRRKDRELPWPKAGDPGAKEERHAMCLSTMFSSETFEFEGLTVVRISLEIQDHEQYILLLSATASLCIR